MNNKQGFTLLEMLLALSVLSVGIMSAFTLAMANLNTARDNYERIRAANLAREGIEIARNIRDTNWLKIEANEDCDTVSAGTQICDWDADLWERGTENGTSTVAYNDTEPNFLDTNIEDCFDDSSCRLYEDDYVGDDRGFYDHNIGGTGTATNMARLINVKAICMDGHLQPTFRTDFDCTGAPDLKMGVLVTSMVYWETSGQSHQVEITEELYNWRSYVDT